MLGSDIIDLVIVKMEEHSPFSIKPGEKMLAGGDIMEEIKPVYSYIETHLHEAADEILLAIPIQHLADIKENGDSLVIKEDKNDSSICVINKPYNWLRLHTLWINGWQRPVHNVIYPENPMYALQFNRWSRGTPQKPVVTDDGLFLHCYSVKDNGTLSIREFFYISHFDKGTDYPRDIAELISLNTARKVYEVFGNTEQSSAMSNEIKVVLENMKL